ncbi:DMT family transporter [Acidovorax sp. Leaf78]|uniref:DMT family transporter n=1 Tax=unclassified Acidovorax TaxID=2684926 RepID=UPI0006F6BBB2|nr:DMT family transporter [Acidovorax sp. Leaf78]KQO19660.1 multidrug DMT transporter [Acidovorax sp. Leaf78]
MPHTRFSDRKVVVALALLCCLLWGSSYPAIKTGYAWFGIARDDIPSQLVFAGWRFLGAGLILLAWALSQRKSIVNLGAGSARQLVVLGLSQTTLQYVFFYVGLAYTTGVKGSIMNATGTFFSVLLAHWVYHNDRLSHAKLWGCLVGFVGVMVVNLGRGTLDMDFTLLGEGFVVIAAFVLAAASIYGKQVSQRMDSVVMTGWQLGIGGAALLAVGGVLGGSLTGFTWGSAALLVYLALLSSAAFSLWSILLKHNRVSQITVFNFTVPIFGAALSALFLGEALLEWKNLLALVLVCAGIWLVTRDAPASTPATPPAKP